MHRRASDGATDSQRSYEVLNELRPSGRAPTLSGFGSTVSHSATVMKFDLIDTVLDQSPDRIVAVKRVDPAEDYLADHFPTFPIMPGVLMVETMVQAARRMLASRGDARLVLGQVKALKFGNFVRPNETLEVEVTLHKDLGDGVYACRGTGVVRRLNAQNNAGETAVSGRFTMRPIRTELVVENDSPD